MLQAYRFALDPNPAQARLLASHCGAARKAFNEGLAHVKRCLDQREAERSYGVPVEQRTGVPWTLPALRRWWNASKNVLAPWWAENSKEAYNSGLAALADGLQQWSASRSGKRGGARIGFPRFKSRRRSPVSCRFTTGAIRADDATHVVLPRIGRIHTLEQTSALLVRVAAGTARVLAATVSFDGRRWYCSFTVETRREPARPARAGADRAHPVVGVDAGVRDLLVVAAPDGTEVARVPAPRSLAAAQARLRHVQRRAARQHGPDRRAGRRGSKRWQRTAGRIGRIHARAADLRRDALHQATTALARRHQVIVIEDLAVANMTRRKPGAGNGGRGLNRALADAGLGELRRQLGYKTTWYRSRLLVAGRWYPSSKTCSGCGAVKAKLALHERTYHCDACGLAIDRDTNAAINLARLSEHATGRERQARREWPGGRTRSHPEDPAWRGRRQRNVNPAGSADPPDGDRPSARRGCPTMSTHIRSRDGNG